MLELNAFPWSLPLKVHSSNRYLQDSNGAPFFYLGDTAWELFHRLNREEAELFLTVRAQQKFTVIQAVVLAEHQYDLPNSYGSLPLVDNDPTRPVEAYFEHVDWIVRCAAKLGMFIGMLPTWGDKWNRKWGGGPEIFTPENASVFGRYLGQRYINDPIIWILGGDRSVENDEHYAIIRAMAQGLREGDNGAHLRTFHPMGQEASSTYFHNDDWLDFNMVQTGHSRNRESWRFIDKDYHLEPTKPCMDAEPCYEDHPADFDAKNGYLDEYDTRKAAYWDLFAGALGHTYGCHDIWQFYSPRFEAINAPRTLWNEAVHLPGAEQMQHARMLIESRPFFERIPDQSLIVGNTGAGAEHLQACRAKDGSYALLYFPTGHPALIDLNKLRGSDIQGTWFDPRTGEQQVIAKFQKSVQNFTPPSHGPGCDWVLILDA